MSIDKLLSWSPGDPQEEDVDPTTADATTSDTPGANDSVTGGDQQSPAFVEQIIDKVKTMMEDKVKEAFNEGKKEGEKRGEKEGEKGGEKEGQHKHHGKDKEKGSDNKATKESGLTDSFQSFAQESGLTDGLKSAVVDGISSIFTGGGDSGEDGGGDSGDSGDDSAGGISDFQSLAQDSGLAQQGASIAADLAPKLQTALLTGKRSDIAGLANGIVSKGLEQEGLDDGEMDEVNKEGDKLQVSSALPHTHTYTYIRRHAHTHSYIPYHTH